MWQDFLELLGSKWMNIMVQRSRQFGQVAPLHLFVVHAIAIPDDLGRAFSCIPAMLQTIQMIIPGLFEPSVRTLRATIPESERHIFR